MSITSKLITTPLLLPRITIEKKNIYMGNENTHLPRDLDFLLWRISCENAFKAAAVRLSEDMWQKSSCWARLRAGMQFPLLEDALGMNGAGLYGS
jgi:hypothetical protein